MKMKTAWIPVFFLVCWLPLSVLAKPVQDTSIETAIEKAAVICAGEVVGYQFDDLKSGETKQTSDRFFLASKYKITEIFRDKTARVKVGETLSIPEKSNTCLVWEETVRKDGDTLVFTRTDDRGGEKKMVEEQVTVELGKKFILFLGEDLQHYGWFISPSPDTPATRTLLKDVK